MTARHPYSAAFTAPVLMQPLYNRLEIILVQCATACDVKPSVAKSKSRKQELVFARQFYCFFARKLTKKSYEQIGALVNLDHASVLHACKVIKNMVDTDYKNVRQIYQTLINQFRNQLN